ncbi:MAG: galactose oxidase [Luteitalea sp.]|nr:galactose oxidase [Luteitalea sp.]
MTTTRSRVSTSPTLRAFGTKSATWRVCSNAPCVPGLALATLMMVLPARGAAGQESDSGGLGEAALPSATSSLDEAEHSQTSTLSWQRSGDLPRPLAGHAVGFSHGVLIVAGGTDFPTPLFEGGSKVWFDSVYALEPAATEWRARHRLPHPLAYAATATMGNRMLVVGGSDQARHYADAFTLEWIGGKITQRALPPFPSPIAMAGAAVIGQTLFVVGGQRQPDDTEALASGWALDLSSPAPAWRALPPVPGPGRILPVVTAQQGRLHVISGAALRRAPSGKATRRYLSDAYSWTPDEGWQRLADVPRPVVAAPAAPFGQSHILVFGGDDGTHASRVEELKDRHPGFSRDVLAYHTITDTWTTFGTMRAVW